MRYLFLLLGFTFSALAGPFMVGLRGGVPLFDDRTVASSLTGGFGGLNAGRRYQVGPTLGVRLPMGFSVEGDALFNRQSLSLSPLAGVTLAGAHADSWQFPVMLKFVAGRRSVAPVLGLGVSVRHINDFGSVPGFLFNNAVSANTVGAVAGAGLRLRTGPVDITPEVRYTRWGGNSFSQSLLNLLPFGRNEAAVLVGITF